MEHAEEPHRHHIKLIAWTVGIVLSIALFVIALLIFLPKPLIVAGTLKTKDGPVPAGTYDFRLKFYNATTRTDVVYTYDAKGVIVDGEGKFTADLPDTKALNVATLMQVCIASPTDSAVPGTIIGGKTTLPSCEAPSESSEVAFNQTICGLTAVDQDPTNTVSWLASKNVVYATPTKACGESTAGIASVSTVDTVAPLLETPGALGELLGGGVSLQPGSLLTVNQDGQVTVETPSEAVSQIVEETVTQTLAETQPTAVPEAGINTVPQTLSLSGNILSISNGNSIILPPSSEDNDDSIGNEITDVIAGNGLVRVGSGTTLDPFRVGLITCTTGEVLKSSGPSAWTCATDDGTAYTAGTGIAFAGSTINNTGVISITVPAGSGLINTSTAQNPTLRLQDCSNGETLQFNGGSWACTVPSASYSFAISDGVTSESIASGNTITFIGNEGLAATVSATDTVTYGIVNGGVTTLKLADGSVTGTKIANNTITTTNLIDGSVTNAKLANNSLTITAGDGLSGGGVATLGSGTTLSLQACANGQILKHNGTTWACAADSGDVNTDNQTLSIVASVPNGANTVSYDLSISNGNTVNFNDRDTLYTALTGGGLTLASGAFSLQACPVGQVLKSTNAGSPAYSCTADTDTNTTYSAGSGLSLAGTTFNANIGTGLSVNGSNQIVNTGVLGVVGSGAITSTGGQNPTIAFANGSLAGQFWQWDGDSWELASLPVDGDSVIGNEVTDVTGGNSGLVRSGSGTAVSPYTLAVSVGSGLQLVSGSVAIDSPTCSGTDKLQWTGTAFICAADIDTNTTYTAGNGIQLTGTSFSINSPTCAGTTKLQWNGTAFICSADVDTNTDAQTLAFDNGTRTLSISDGNSVVIPDANTTYSALTNGGLRLVGTEFALKTCTSGQILKAQATSGDWDCAADADTNTTYSAGTGLSLVGTTFNNTGVLSVAGSGAITSTGGQNPTIAFANGASIGQFWQWDGDSWELASLPAEADGVVGNEVTNVTGVNSGLARSGTGTAVDPYTLAISTGNGLQLTGGSVAINSPTCSGTTKLQWNGTAFVCSADIDTDTTNFSITDGSTSQDVAAAQAITFSGDVNTKTTVTLGGTRQLTFGLDLTGATSGQVLAYNGTNLAWQSPTTYAPTNCSATSTYICQSGNTLGGALTIGTNDTQTLNFETNNATAITVLSNGRVGIGNASPGEKLDVNGNISMPATSASAGAIMYGNTRVLHTYGGISNLFVGQSAGNLTQTGTFNVGLGGQALQNITSGSFNTAVSANGLLNTTTGSSNTAVGLQALMANTTGSDNTAIGHNAGYTGTSGAFGNVSGTFNTFIGSAAGPGSATQLNGATAIGAYSRVDQHNSISLGCTAGVSNCPSTTPVGIGNSAPSYLLHVGSAASMASGTSVARFQNAGGTCTVNPTTAGGITCTSDERAKKNIEDFTNAIDLIEKIHIKKYNMKADNPGTTKQVGVIAQEVEDVLPGLVITDADGSKSFSYAGLAPILLQAIKEQQVQIDQIEAGMWTGGIVSKDTTFQSQAIFEGPARFMGEATFDGDVAISGKVKLSKDQVNSVILPKGQRSIKVLFGGSYKKAPYITATPREFLRGTSQYRITKVSKTGFSIEVNETQHRPIQFDWHAFSH